MTLFHSASLVNNAYQNKYAVVHINTNGGNVDIVRAIIEAAQEEQAPVILAANEANLTYPGYDYASMVLTHFAEQANVPVSRLPGSARFGHKRVWLLRQTSGNDRWSPRLHPALAIRACRSRW